MTQWQEVRHTCSKQSTLGDVEQKCTYTYIERQDTTHIHICVIAEKYQTQHGTLFWN